MSQDTLTDQEIVQEARMRAIQGEVALLNKRVWELEQGVLKRGAGRVYAQTNAPLQTSLKQQKIMKEE